MTKLVGIGNAILDIVCFVDDQKLESMGLVKGAMTLIDEAQVVEFKKAFEPTSICSGGSVANTLACAAHLETSCQFIGVVADDDAGLRFAEDLNAVHVLFEPQKLFASPPTGRCYVLVTEDAQRTMCTYIGAATHFPRTLIREHVARNAQVILIEGYLWEAPLSKAAIFDMLKDSSPFSGKIAMSLSDALLVARNREELQGFVTDSVDILFGNIREAQELFQTSGLEDTLDELSTRVDVLVVTRSELGSVAIVQGKRYEQSAFKCQEVLDTTGAGDAYAGGFLSEYIAGSEIPKCMYTATEMSTRVIQGVGARVGR